MAFICAAHPSETRELGQALACALRRISSHGTVIHKLTWLGCDPPMPYPPKTGVADEQGVVTWSSPSVVEAIATIQCDFDRDVLMRAHVDWTSREGRRSNLVLSAHHTNQRHAFSSLGLDVETSTLWPSGRGSSVGDEDARELLLAFAGGSRDEARLGWAALVHHNHGRAPLDAFAVVRARREDVALDFALAWVTADKPRLDAANEASSTRERLRFLLALRAGANHLGMRNDEVLRLLELPAAQVIGAFEDAANEAVPPRRPRVEALPGGGLLLVAATGETLAPLYDRALHLLFARGA